MKKIIYVFFICLICSFIKNASIANTYSDLDNSHWAYQEITSLSKNNVLFGYPDNTFKPDEPVTRAEFASMVINSLNQQNAELDGIINFKDLPETNWAYKNVQRAVRFDLIKGTPEGYFYPNEPVTIAQVISVTVNALDTCTISENKAREVLKSVYEDYCAIPDWVIINAGKAEILDMNIKTPNSKNIYNAEKNASRAEAAVAIYKMVQQAKLNPNKKLAEAMKPKKAEGIVINSAIYKGSYITIPEGTKLPVVMLDKVSSQTSTASDLFLAKIPQNYITPEKYLIIAENSPIAGQILEVKRGKYFIRNGKITMQTRTIRTSDKNQEANFNSIVDTKIKRKFWAKIGRAIFKGAKINLKSGQYVEVELLKPIKIDTTNGEIVK